MTALEEIDAILNQLKKERPIWDEGVKRLVIALAHRLDALEETERRRSLNEAART